MSMLENYMSEILRTESTSEIMRKRASDKIRLLHAALGLADETGEFAKAVKSHIYYGKALDIDNIVEEIGDVLWFCGLALDTVGMELEDAIQVNVAKLRARYPAGFSETRATGRDLTAESEAMKGEKR